MLHGKQFAMPAVAGGVLGVLVLGLLGLGFQDLYADADNWIPVVAKLRRTVTELPDSGKPVETEVWEGTYLRDFRGSELEKLEKIRPRPAQPMHQGRFVDRSGRKGKVYKLAFRTRTALLMQDNTPERPVPAVSREQLRTAGREEDRVHGIRCFVIPMETTLFRGVEFSGRGCYSPEYDLHLYQVLDSTVRGSGLTTRTRTEFYDFQLGAAPTADKMRLPTGFVVQESLCSACSGTP